MVIPSRNTRLTDFFYFICIYVTVASYINVNELFKYMYFVKI